MTGLSPYQLFIPVFSAEEAEPGIFNARAEVAGTCFHLGEGYFMTAAHVVHAATSNGRDVVLGMPDPGSAEAVHVMRTLRTEILEDDIALIEVATRRVIPADEEIAFRWRRTNPVQLNTVWTLGYAHGTHLVNGRHSLLQRAFSGHVVADPAHYEIPGCTRPFAALELSFQAPRGLSGAPLLSGPHRSLSQLTVGGVVVGNSAMRMLVHQSEYHEDDGVRRVVTHEYESLTLGLAVQAQAILALTSTMLGGTIADYVGSRGRLIA